MHECQNTMNIHLQWNLPNFHSPSGCYMEKKNVKFGKEFDGSKGTTSATESRISYQGSGQFYLW